MEYKERYVYHIKDSYFAKAADDKLMANKENDNFRPTFFCIKDSKTSLLWVVPLSSRVEKYKTIVEKQSQKYGKSLGIVIGEYDDKPAAYLIQNMFPIIEKYLDHIHTKNGNPVPVKFSLQQEVKSKVQQARQFIARGKNVVFPDVKRLEKLMLVELETEQEIRLQGNIIDIQKSSILQNIKDNKIISKCVYSVLGINMEGHKEILGTWISENESASFYASICSDLKNRGVTDIFVACHDNLTGLNDAIKSIFPKSQNQLCIVHQIRNSCKFVPYKDRKAVCADLRNIYGAVNLDDAEYAKEEFRDKWDKKYPNILKSWEKNWAELTTFFVYPAEVRKIIYTTNAVEGYHRMVRKFTKTKAIFPTDDSIRKVIYLTASEISKKWTMPIRDWGLAYAQFAIFFEDRFAA